MKSKTKKFNPRSSNNDDYDYYNSKEEEYDDDDGDMNMNMDGKEYGDNAQQRTWEWETYRKTTHIYLPPPVDDVPLRAPRSQSRDEFDETPKDESKHELFSQIPKSIIHFVGGTLFGSYPLQFYKPLLERIAEKSNSIVIATSIPVTLSKNPLNHYMLSKNIAFEFSKAYQNVIVDEYGSEAANDMKIVGLGHSLGSRLQVIISTSRKLKRIGFERDGNILIAFNNYNAGESVPGVRGLEKGIQNTLNGDGNRDGRGRSRGSSNRSIPRSDAYYDDYEIGISDVVNAVSEGLQDQVSTIKTAITPDLDKQSLEFQPSPQQLWDGVEKEYEVDKTLLVQFDQDMIDQSSRLAKAIMESERFSIATMQEPGVVSVDMGSMGSVDSVNATTKSVIETLDETGIGMDQDSPVDTDTSTRSFIAGASATNVTSNEPPNTYPSKDKDMKFARLRGTHLTPVSYSDTFIIQAMKRAGASASVFFGQSQAQSQDQILQEAIQEENDYRPSSKRMRAKVQNQDIENLSSCIARYVTDIVIGL
jgi:hypothetical protein